MKIVIDSVVYDVMESMQGAALGDLRTLKKETGVSVRSISQTFMNMGERMKDDDGDLDPSLLLEDEDFLDSMIGLIWLARRKAGEKVTLEDAADTSFNAFHLDFDDDEEEPELPKDEAAESTDPSV